MGLDTAMHAAVDGLPVVDLHRPAAQVVDRRGTWAAEGVVLEEDVAVVEVDPAQRGLGQQVQDIGAGAAEADDDRPVPGQFAGHVGDTRPAGRRVEILERCIPVRRFYDPVGAGRDGGVERFRRAREDGGVGGHQLVIVGVALGRLAGECVIHDERAPESLTRAAGADAAQRPALRVAGEVAGEGGDMGGGPDRPVARQGEGGDQTSEPDPTLGVHIGDAVQHQVAADDFDLIAVVDEPLKVGTTSD